MKDATLCYIFSGDKVLLQKKAPGRFGAGKWNAPGGKIKVMETPEKAAVREVHEETGLEVSGLQPMGLLNFFEQEGRIFSVHVFQAGSFRGEARGGPEGELKWFNRDSLPMEEMWEDDRIWLPMMLKGERFKGDFLFSKGFKSLLKHKVEKL